MIDSTDLSKLRPQSMQLLSGPPSPRDPIRHVRAAGCLLALLAFALLPARPSIGDGAIEPPDNGNYLAARANARSWLDALEVDPVDLLAHGIKGKKKLAEILEAYALLKRHRAVDGEPDTLEERVTQLVAHTARAEYHNLLVCSDEEFRQNSMSYLRVLWLMQQLGFESDDYLGEIKRIKPRLDAHMESRGSWQRAMFLSYYERFKLPAPSILMKHPLLRGVIGRRVKARDYDSAKSYQLTHEVFTAFDYGLDRTQQQLDGRDRSYLREILPYLAEQSMQSDNPDLLAEIVSAMTYLGHRSEPAYQRAVLHLLKTQNPDGTWGDYEHTRPYLGDYADQHLYLHTTVAALRALVEAFEGNWPSTCSECLKAQTTENTVTGSRSKSIRR